jgi:CRISPR-associated protein Csb2
MIQIEFRFPGGRYHATPWGHHVNEGLVEWPPSPWRLVRAFIATAHTKLGVTDPVPEDHPLRKLVAALAAQTPSFSAAPCPATHSRHYMPLGGKDGKTTLVLDTCAVPGDEPLVVSWPVDLNEVCRDLLQQIVGTMGYLGRAESWVEGRLLSETVNVPDDHRMTPHEAGMSKGPGWEQTSLLAPTSTEEYARLFADFARQVETAHPLPQGKKKPDAALLKRRAVALSPYPTDLFDCLTRDTTFLQMHGWSQPPGSRRVLYWRPSHSLSTAPLGATRRAEPAKSLEAVLLALASDTRRHEVLPLLSRALPQAELLHRSLVSHVGHGQPIPCSVLTGKDAVGQRLTGHQHLHIIPLNLDAREPGRLDHFLLWAPMGIDAQAQEAIFAVRKTWTKGGEKPLFVTVAGMGSLSDFQPLLGQQTLRPSCVWESRTPFVPPRFVKKRGTNTVEGQVLSELASRGFPKAKVEPLNRDETTDRRLHRFVRLRRAAGKLPPQDCFYGLRITFDEEVCGPLALGYASHFGLGLFEPADSQ